MPLAGALGRARRDSPGAAERSISAADGKELHGGRQRDAARPRSSSLLRPVCGRAAPTDPNRTDGIVGAAVLGSSSVTS